MPSRLPSCALVLIAIGLLASIARAGGGGPDAELARRVIDSVFFVAKSENKNQVHYGIWLDATCAPLGDEPVFAYWRMLEHGPLATEPLLSREVAAYGVASQRTKHAGAGGAGGGQVRLVLNALPRRPIVVSTTAQGAGCAASANAPIGGAPASLTSVFVQLRWPFGVDYLMLAGRGATDGHIVRERVAE